MTRFRTHRQHAFGALPPRVHVVSPNAPARPRWGHLYLALLVVTAAGTTLHCAVGDPWLVEVVDLLLCVTLFAALAGWIHVNRIALVRLDEPAGAARPQVRIIRSRTHDENERRRRDVEDRIILPFDFR